MFVRVMILVALVWCETDQTKESRNSESCGAHECKSCDTVDRLSVHCLERRREMLARMWPLGTESHLEDYYVHTPERSARAEGGRQAEQSVCVPLVECKDDVMRGQAGTDAAQECQLSDHSHGVWCDPEIERANPLRAYVSANNSDFYSRARRSLQNNGYINSLRPLPLAKLSDDKLDTLRLTRSLIEQNKPIADDRTNSDEVRRRNPSEASQKATYETNLLNRNHRYDPEVQHQGVKAIGSLKSWKEQYMKISNRTKRDLYSYQVIEHRHNIKRLPNCQNVDPPPCYRSYYNSIDGSCNNLVHPTRGQAKTGFKRLQQNTYEDGLYEMRKYGVKGIELPNARAISQYLFASQSRTMESKTLSLMQWGQLIDHDLSHQALFRKDNGDSIECCLFKGRVLPRWKLHEQCIPIEVEPSDKFYTNFGIECLNLVRTLPHMSESCEVKPSVPINTITAYMDASMVYGSSEAVSRHLRSRMSGNMRMEHDFLLPLTDKESSILADDECRTDFCFEAGDSRVNEQSGLAVMHTILIREHNRIANIIRQRHKSYSDDLIYLETRRILIAELQHITYNEWLPIIVGHDYARNHGLLPLNEGYSPYYNENTDASISTEFATAAFRFGHSLITEDYKLIDVNGFTSQVVNITSTFFDPSVLSMTMVSHARAFITGSPQAFDRHVSRSVHEKLFTENQMHGMDLIAINIQRGRDHGLPTYVKMRQTCTGHHVRRWSQLLGVIDVTDIERMRAIYHDVEDVDLFVGGMLEMPVDGALVGETFRCIIAQQFFDLRFGDRYFYDNGQMPHSFTLKQLNEIRKSSYSRLLCDTMGLRYGGDLTVVQPLGFAKTQTPLNEQADCRSKAIPEMRLDFF